MGFDINLAFLTAPQTLDILSKGRVNQLLMIQYIEGDLFRWELKRAVVVTSLSEDDSPKLGVKVTVSLFV